MQTCPPPEYLREFLDEHLSAADAAALTQHLESCAACRQALDRLSTDADSVNWRRLREPRSQTGDEPRPDFLRRLEGVLAPGSALSQTLSWGGRARRGARAGNDRLPTPAGYELLEKRGRGGIGVVYKARDLRLKRTVALKMLLTGVESSAEDRIRLRAEAEAVARLQHPNIVQIHEIGEQDGCPFLVLEFVEGGSLSERLRNTPQPPPAAAKLLETVARAVHYAHQHGVVHRDLKPANILLEAQNPQVEGQKGEEVSSGSSDLMTSRPSDITSHGRLDDLTPKITDFGLAKRLDEVGHTQTGQVLGTPSYMAPEQARGRSKSIGPAADIYALGAILYQLLTGRPPFQGVTAVDTMMQVLHEEPVPPRRLQPRVPHDLETICLKCLAKEPRQRYASALDLAEDLRRFQAGETIKGRPVGPLGQTWRWCRRHPGPAGLLAALVLVLGAGIAGVTWSYMHALAAQRSEAAARQEEAEQRERAELHLYYSRIALAEREWDANNVARAEDLLDQCLPAEGRPDRRGWEWYYLKRLCHSDLATVQAHRAPLSGLAFSPDGKYLASSAGDRGYRGSTRNAPGELTIWDTRWPERPEKLVDLGARMGRVDGVVFDRTGAHLASVSTDNTLRIWDAPFAPFQRPREPFPISIHEHWRGATPAFSPDGKTVAAPSLGELRFFDLATREKSALPTDQVFWVGPCAFSPDGALLAMSGGRRGGGEQEHFITVWNAQTRRELYRVPVETFALAFSPDSKLLAAVSGIDVLLVDAATGKEVLTLRGHTGRVDTLAWAPGGQFLASAGADLTARVWNVKTGREHRIFRGHTGRVYSLAYHPEGHRLVTGDESGVLKVWNADRHQRVLELQSTRSDKSVAFTADGGQVRTVDPTGFRGWDVTTSEKVLNKPVRLVRHSEYPLRYLALSPDGRFCAGPDPKDRTTLVVWDVATGERLRTLTGHRTGVRSVAFSPDGQRLACATGVYRGAEPHELVLWALPEPGRGEPSRTDLPCACPVQSVAFSADGRWLVAGERGTYVAGAEARDDKWLDGHLSIWDTTTGQQLRRWAAHAGPVQSVAIDPTGRWIASGERARNGVVRIWDAETGERLHDLRSPVYLTCVTFNPDGTRLAAVGYEGMVHLWDPATGLDVLTLRGPWTHIPEGGAYDTQVVFSPDGTRLAVNSWTGSIYVWDARPLDGK
jgi:WD40 repeat protein/serine/threonine protein kinase